MNKAEYFPEFPAQAFGEVTPVITTPYSILAKIVTVQKIFIFPCFVSI